MIGTRMRASQASLLAAGIIFGSLTWLNAAAAQEDRESFLEQVRRLNEVAAQKVEADVRASLRDAMRLSANDPDKALEGLRKTLAKIEDNADLPQDRRERLVKTLKDRIRITAALARRAVDPQDNRLQIAGSNRRADEDSRVAEQRTIRRSLDAIRDLQRDGRFDEARRQADDLANRYPGNLTAEITRRNAATVDLSSVSRQQRAESARRLSASSREMSRSAMPPAGEVEFPRDWQERTKNRSATAKLTDKEKAIVKALNTPITVNFKNVRFEEIIQNLSEQTGLPILLDRNALAEAQVDYDTRLSEQVKGVALRTLLKKILGGYGLAYVIKDQSIQVTSALKAKETMVVRSYYMGDLLGNGGVGGFVNLPFSPELNQLQATKQAAQLIDMITSSIEPSSWEKNGGTGSIAFHAGTMALVIKNSAEVHAMLGGGLSP